MVGVGAPDTPVSVSMTCAAELAHILDLVATLARATAAVKPDFSVRVNSTELGETEEEERRETAAGGWRRSEELERDSLGVREA